MNDRFVHACGKRRFCPSGERKRPIFKRVSDSGCPAKLAKIGESDLQDFIQSFADECDVNRIVQRYANGDTTVLQRVQGMYTDVVGVPTDLTTAFETVNAARAYYDSLPAAVKREFGSLGKFLDSIRTIPSEASSDDNSKKEVSET